MNNVLFDSDTSIAAPRSDRRHMHVAAQNNEIFIAVRAIRHSWRNAATLLYIVHAPHVARMIAMMSGVHAAIQVGASIAAGFPSLLPPGWETDAYINETLYNITLSCSGTWMDRLASIAPSGWGAPISDAIIRAVDRWMCRPGSAAALLGPSDSSAHILITAREAAFAIRRWGNAVNDDPAWWVHAISGNEQRRVLSLVNNDARIAATIVPWLPDPHTTAHALPHAWIGAALHAYADASDTVIRQHRDIIQYLATRADHESLGDLARLAIHLPSLWNIVRTLLGQAPSRAYAVTLAVPWSLLPKSIRSDILERKWQERTCAAIAYARGLPISVPMMDELQTVAFLSALNPKVWRQHTEDTRHRWLSMTPSAMRYLGVRALGADIEALAWCSIIDMHVIQALQRDRMTNEEIRWHLLPMFLADLSPMTANAIINELPTPPPNETLFHAIITTRRHVHQSGSPRMQRNDRIAASTRSHPESFFLTNIARPQSLLNGTMPEAADESLPRPQPGIVRQTATNAQL